MKSFKMFKYFKRWHVDAQYKNVPMIFDRGEWRDDSLSIEVVDIKIIYPMPMRPEEREYLPEGEVYRDHLVTWTPTAPTPAASGTNGDRLLFEGNEYEITSYSDRTEGGYYRLIIKRLVI